MIEFWALFYAPVISRPDADAGAFGRDGSGGPDPDSSADLHAD